MGTQFLPITTAGQGTFLSRRDSLKSVAGTLIGATFCADSARSQSRESKAIAAKAVAAVVTVYREKSHADVLIGKILEGWKQDGGPGPALKLASLYVDQFPPQDLARKLAEKHKFPIFDSIEKTLTLGTDGIAVDGVISIGEHGDYPWNDLQQHLYPRKRFFEAITDTFAKYKRVVPVFNDKHLGPVWSDAKWMYDRAQSMKIPFMAGSSLPLTFRQPDVQIPLGGDIEAAVGIGYDGLDIYGSHALECYQCIVERRRGGETGVKSVQCLTGEEMWKAVDNGMVAKELFQAALGVVPHKAESEMRKDKGAALFLFDYESGFRGSVFMLSHSASRTSIGLKLRGQSRPIAMQFEERPEPRHPHFAYLLKAIERMMHTGRPTYPVERTLLTSGMLDRAINSQSQGQRKFSTPELAIRYQPVDYPNAPKPELNADPSGR